MNGDFIGTKNRKTDNNKHTKFSHILLHRSCITQTKNKHILNIYIYIYTHTPICVSTFVWKNNSNGKEVNRAATGIPHHIFPF